MEPKFCRCLYLPVVKAILCFLLVVLPACSHPKIPPQIQTDVLATIGSDNITIAQFSAEMTSRRTPDDPKAKRVLLDEMIRTRTLVQEARRHGYDHDPQVIAAYDLLLVNRLREEVHAQAKATSQEIGAYYTAHPAEFAAPAAVHAAVIFVAAPAQLPAAVRTQRRTAIDAARQQASELPPNTVGFGALAAQNSDDQATKFRGGDMGYLLEGVAAPRWEKPVLDAVFALTPAAPLSPVVTTDRGFYLVKLIARHDASTRPLNYVRADIEKRLTEEKERQLMADLEKKASQQQPIKVYAERLSALSPLKSPNQPVQTASSPPPNKCKRYGWHLLTASAE